MKLRNILAIQYIYLPIYIANYCQNYCILWNSTATITFMKKTFIQEIEHEMKVIADTGMEEILILTGRQKIFRR